MQSTPPAKVNRNHRVGKEIYGPIRSGQQWIKRDTGIFMTVDHKSGDNCWTVNFAKKSNHRAHHLKERDIYKYYDKV
jgi:hypothetical protein